MEHLSFLVIIAILLLMLFALGIKVYFLRRSVKEITESFRDRLAADTNTLIDISSRDSDLRKLASEINVQLRLLRKERHQYQQGDMELKEAVINISHDLRTPLTVICGYLDLLEREENSEAAKRYLSQIRNRTEAMKNLMEDFFQYSMVASSHNLKMECLDIGRELEENLLSFYGAMHKKGIQPEISIPEEPVYRELDARALNRVFSNIISNAVKYSDGDLCVTMGKDGNITFDNAAKDVNAITVGRLFDRYYTVDSGRDSTGLGLSIARTLVERMNGKITAEYKDNRLSVTVCFSAF